MRSCVLMQSRLYRPLIGFGVNEYHPSMAQSLKSKYLLLALGRRRRAFAAAWRLRLLRASDRQRRHRPAHLRDGRAEARGRSRGARRTAWQRHRCAARSRVGCPQQRGHRLDRRTPARGGRHRARGGDGCARRGAVQRQQPAERADAQSTAPPDAQRGARSAGGHQQHPARHCGAGATHAGRSRSG